MEHPATRAPAAKTSFFRSLWQAVLRFDEALSSDPRTDLAHRVAVLERHIVAARGAASDSQLRQ